MIYPVGDGTREDFEKNWYVAAYFGDDRGSYFHTGYDLNKKTGGNTDLKFPLLAIAKGKIVYYHNNSHPTKNYGRHNVLCIEGPWGKRWVHYAHNHVEDFLGRIEAVDGGKMIARIGNSGTDWAHCHFALFKVDPKTLRNSIDTVPKTKTELNKWFEDPLDFIEKWYNYKEPLIEADMDKTKIDLGSPWGELEIGVIKSKLNDGLRDFTNLENKYKKLLENPPSGGLSSEQIGALGDVLKNATKAQFELTNKKIQAVQVAVDLTETNLTGDREGLGTMQVDQASTLNEIREFKNLLTKQTEKINEGVKATVEKAIISIADKIQDAVKLALNGFIDKEPTIRKKTLWEKLSFWK